MHYMYMLKPGVRVINILQHGTHNSCLIDEHVQSTHPLHSLTGPVPKDLEPLH